MKSQLKIQYRKQPNLHVAQRVVSRCRALVFNEKIFIVKDSCYHQLSKSCQAAKSMQIRRQKNIKKETTNTQTNEACMSVWQTRHAFTLVLQSSIEIRTSKQQLAAHTLKIKKLTNLNRH